MLVKTVELGANDQQPNYEFAAVKPFIFGGVYRQQHDQSVEHNRHKLRRRCDRPNAGNCQKQQKGQHKKRFIEHFHCHTETGPRSHEGGIQQQSVFDGVGFVVGVVEIGVDDEVKDEKEEED